MCTTYNLVILLHLIAFQVFEQKVNNGQFQVTVFSRFCYVLLCNHEYIHCLNHTRQAKAYITKHMKPRENFNLKEGYVKRYLQKKKKKAAAVT